MCKKINIKTDFNSDGEVVVDEDGVVVDGDLVVAIYNGGAKIGQAPGQTGRGKNYPKRLL